MIAGLTIKRKIFWSIYSVILILTILADSLVFIAYKKDIEEKIENFGNQTIDEMALNMTKNILNAEESITYKIKSSELVENNKDKPYIENSTEIKKFVALVANSGMNVRSCYMKRTNGSEEFWSDGAIDINEFQELLVRTYINDNNSNNNRGTAQWKYFKDTPDSIYIVKNVIDYDTLKKSAIICLQIDRSYFHMLETNNDLSIMVCDNDGDLLYNSDDINSIVDDIKTGRNDEYIELYEQLSKKKWVLTGLISRQQALQNLWYLIFSLIFIEAILVFVSFFIADYVSENMTLNIKKLTHNMKLIEQGKKAEMILAKSTDETAYLVNAFNDMNNRLNEAIDELTIKQTQKEKAEYNDLIAQINPHFLYNSLESINAMAKLNDQKEIVDAIGNLSRLLRICLSETSEEITVKKELNYITQYLSLERLITGGQVDWEIDAGDNLENCLVPKLILQPVVENCIVHGFQGYCGDAIIIIVVRMTKDRLIMEVSDNGNGMSQKYADEILESKEVWKEESDRRHIGIKSIQQRIRYLYGNEYGISIVTGHGEGTTVKLILPVRKGDIDNV